MAEPRRLDLEKAQLLVIDIQEKLLPHIHEHEALVASAVKMIRAAQELGMPITISEQYPAGLGRTPTAITVAAKDAARVEKMAFSVCGDEASRDPVMQSMRSQVLVVGIETHVCVQQTVLDLLAEQHRPIVLADAVGSRRPVDREVALQRMRAEGALITTVESAIFELVERSDSELFKRILPIVK